MNEALLTKHLHKLYNKEEVPWVQLVWNTHYTDGKAPHASTGKGSFWLKDIMKLSDRFRGIATATVGPGDTIMLWEDVWNGHYLKAELPRLFSYAKDKQITLAQFMLNPEIQQHLYTTLPTSG
jgi:hypothetical protein